MRKIFLMILVCLFLIPAICEASFLAEINGTREAHINKINFTGPETLTRVAKKITIPVVDATLIAAGAANGGATSMTTSDLAVPTGYSYIRKALTSNSGFTAGTLANGKKGELKTIHIVVGSGSFTVTPATATGMSSFVLDAIGEVITLLYIDDTVGWTLFGDTDATVNLP